MSIEIKNSAFDDIDLNEVDLDKLTSEQYAQLLQAKGMVGKENYTEERCKWQDSLDVDEIKKVVYRTAQERKNEQADDGKIYNPFSLVLPFLFSPGGWFLHLVRYP